MGSQVEPEVVVVDTPFPEKLAAIRRFLRGVAISEKHWPPGEVDAALARTDATYVAVFDRDRCVGAAQVFLDPPYVYRAVFPDAEAQKDSAEVNLISVELTYRGKRKVLDALVKGVYWLAVSAGRAYLYTLFEEWTTLVFDQGVKVIVRKLQPGAHYWCGTERCGDDCQLTFLNEIDLRGSEARVKVERPSFWTYLNN